ERLFEKTPGLLMRREELLDQIPQCSVWSARAVQVGGPFGWRYLLYSGQEDLFCVHRVWLLKRGVSLLLISATQESGALQVRGKISRDPYPDSVPSVIWRYSQ